MANYKNITESGVITSRPGTLAGFVVNLFTGTGTLKFWDGSEAGVQATSTLTSTGAFVEAAHATNRLTSTGAMVAGTHAVTVLTGSANFKDAVKASAVLTSDQTNATAGKCVTIGSTVYYFRAAADMNDSTDVLLGSTAAETMANLYDKLRYDDEVDAVLTSTYVITVTAKTAGTAGNAIAKAEDDSHLDWDGSGAYLTGGLAAETITIGTTVYTFTSGPCDTAYKVAIGADLTESLLHLKKAINGTKPADGYAQNTSAHTSVVCTASDGTTITIRGRVPGTSLNAVATTETCASASWADTTLGGGTGASDAGVTPETVTIGTTVYSAVVELSETLGATAVAYQVLYGGSVAVFLDNLKLAINGTGTVGTEYSTGTVAHTTVVAGTNSDTVQIVFSRLVGNDAAKAVINAIATTETLGNCTWADTTLGGGTGTCNPAVSTDAAQVVINGRTYTFVTELSETAGAAAVADEVLAGANPAASLVNLKKAINASGIAGTDYSTGTTQNIDVFAGAIAADSLVITAYDAGVYGNAITTTENMANTAWTSTVMASGEGSRSSPIMGTITIPAVTVGPLLWQFPSPLSFQRGLYVAVAGTTMDATIEYN